MAYLEKIQKRVTKRYFLHNERLSWAPFPSCALLCNDEPDPIRNIITRICRYYGGESISLEYAKQVGAFPAHNDCLPYFEKEGYFYGRLSLEDKWLRVLEERGRLVIYLHSSASEKFITYSYSKLESSNVFIFSETSLKLHPKRVLSDLLLFITNHEAPVIIRDFLNEFSPALDKLESTEAKTCSSSVSENEFSEALSEGLIFDQDYKLYRIN